MKAAFSRSSDVFAWLARFIAEDHGQNQKSYQLARFQTLTRLAGYPERGRDAVHIAGSKGKGSVTGMITAMLEASGQDAARYTSPHVSSYQERITRGNRFFDEQIYTDTGNELRELIDSLLRPGTAAYAAWRAAEGGGETPGFFELLTLYFFMTARRAACSVMVVETGIGGRLDSTNVIDPLVSVITEIELEHTDILGTSIEAIASEKAGIIKPGRPVVLMEQEEAALRVFRHTAAEKQSSLIYFPEHAEARNIAAGKDGSTFTLAFKNSRFFSAPLDITLRIPGEVQIKNAGLAVLAAKTAYPELRPDAAARGLAAFSLPARFERIQDAPPVIIDGAHTPVSIKYCAGTFTDLYGKGGILIFGCAARKDARNMAEILAGEFSKIVITTPGGFRSSEPEQVYGIFREILSARNLRSRTELVFIRDTGEAIARMLAWGRETGLPALSAGSFYLAAEIRNTVIC
ncbi:MAG: tetrahydrofolate synthase [Spirochaetaceae bacterium]|jgi:dihydrofolate synthase/folylpolyglutamate synthase|nr:tetrahydrofolate synthase [Spirochaetaceae bacterium]